MRKTCAGRSEIYSFLPVVAYPMIRKGGYNISSTRDGASALRSASLFLACSIIASFGHTALAGTITFTPLDGTVVSNDGSEPTSIRFVVGLLDDFDSVGSVFTGAALDMGVNGGPQVEFELGDFPFHFHAIDPPSVFDSGWHADFFGTGGPGAMLPFHNVGTITIDATGVASGSYSLEGIGGVGFEQMEAAIGSAKFDVVPEPATLSLLALGVGASILSKRRWR